jgi:hypothetical protein
MYVHGLGDAQERMSRDEYDEPYEIAWREAKKENVCPCCGSNKELDLYSHEELHAYFDEDYFEIEFEFLVDCCEEKCQENEVFKIEFTYEN